MNWTLTIINYKKDGFYEKESNLIKMMNCGIHYIRWIRILNPYNVNLSENAVHLFPNERDTLFWYGESIDLINRELSENIFMRLLNRFPEDSDAWYRLARIYESKNEYDKSLECFINACNFGDIRSNGCYNAGRMFEKQGDYLNAIYYYKLSKWRPYHEAADRLEAELSSQNP
jgi:tetratricopeptide (TPR) repeat protein